MPTVSVPPLSFPAQAYAEMIGNAYDGYPLEACGLLVGRGTRVHRFVACTNEAASARVYTIPGKELLRAEMAAVTTPAASSSTSPILAQNQWLTPSKPP